MLSMYLLVLQGGLAAGASLWGAVAEQFGMSEALSVAALALVIGLIVSRNHRLNADGLRFHGAPAEH
jgi:predicted MFS family arabinose efflux permease